ncbi:N-acetylglucosamine-6-phosphate deacetylase [Paenibacillus sambharensis]|uniref:N-acetylglucosamine-6-phosphate deacetylase n=1 Tax=Paenibacillus sambharensis TaxID=1803190 RepID=A0A2W1L571_9BACL|nr:N-acetylglucosamine-6-phosphate deacetylase [Paenibacillus sambharensis]PZD94073.1 N-acetylglucosamine-6-phosphate deacetylase [Paenibacillus sambharensis]
MPDSKTEWRLYNAQIAAGSAIIHGSVHIRNGQIHAVEATGAAPPHAGSAELPSPDGRRHCPAIDADGGWLLPGFIDIHCHGGLGGDFMDASDTSYEQITRFHAAHGTTAMLATTVTASKPAIDKVLAAAASFRQEGSSKGARLLGAHLEGPFISPRWPGAQNPAYIAEPNTEWLKQWTAEYPDLIRIVTLAPEQPGASELIRFLKEKGIVASCGHTDASYDVITEAANSGLQHAVHTFNAMRGLHHREPGTAGAVLTLDDISTEVIADGHHVHAGAIRLLLRCKPLNKVILITDAISAAGLGDGSYELGGLPLSVKDGVARLQKDGSLAGSTLTMLSAFRFVIEHCGLSPLEASRLASANPALLLGMEEHLGTIASGKSADLVLLNRQLEHQATWVNGELAG